MTLLRSNLAPTLEEFLKLPETKPASEYIDGKIYRKPMPQGKHSTIQIELASAIKQAGKAKKLAYAFTELRCTFAGRSIVPDIAVFEWQNIPVDKNGQIANKFTIAPDWIIEIFSPNQATNQVIRKIVLALKNGTKLGYFIDPDDESVMVFQPNQLPDVKEKQDILPVLDVLQDWQLKVADIFSWLKFV
ncbi:Uma2 family endonuclease [Myxosarcina sp. GI1]|uniref:Uma2 family endonuclease n=1 Tax=Myxosarcina sp. GI1 TaxID=1541065 RepID=UPI00055B66F3|nr:Uma2 family endonuclease [Myxosarcina sp. GI1]